jgi:hypothetical protein
MRRFIYLLPFIFSVFIFSSCDNKDIDTQTPTISNSFNGAFPINCDTLYFGEANKIELQFSDDIELGSYSLDIHHNFDQHAHSTDVDLCKPDPVKTAINPYVFIADYKIAAGLKNYNASITLNIPPSSEKGLFDNGDYHFFVSLTDKSGW